MTFASWQRPLSFLLLVLAFSLRLYAGFNHDPQVVYNARGGGDDGWYLAYGEALLTLEVPYTSYSGLPTDRRNTPTPPLYLLFVGVPQILLGAGSVPALQVIWTLQALMGTLIALVGARMALRLTQSKRAELSVLAVLALHPVLIYEAGTILTETLYLFWVMLALWMYTKSERTPAVYALVGALLAFATLTRAVALMFPALLVVHSLLAQRQHWRRVLLLLLVYGVLVGTWTLYNLPYGRLVIASDQFSVVLWRGSLTETSLTPQQLDAQIAEQTGCTVNCTGAVSSMASDAITQDTGGFIQRRLAQWFSSIFEPYGVQSIGGSANLRALSLNFLQKDLSLAGLGRLISAEGFFVNALIYLLWYGALGLGCLGMWQARQQWRLTGAWVAFIAYTLGIHLVILALPRYIFPTLPLWVIFASYAVQKALDKWRSRRA
jgi:4-amino-4-deoxy-L-arabinose transferase-like glycosyltransferase